MCWFTGGLARSCQPFDSDPEVVVKQTLKDTDQCSPLMSQIESYSISCDCRFTPAAVAAAPTLVGEITRQLLTAI